jgi:hypothetical protein
MYSSTAKQKKTKQKATSATQCTVYFKKLEERILKVFTINKWQMFEEIDMFALI